MLKRSIVILQDSYSTIEDMKKIISTSDEFEVVGESVNGDEGLSIIEKTRPDILILGIILRKLDGLYVLEEIKNKGYDTKIVVVSSFTREDMIQSVIKGGAYYYIAKPYNDDILLRRIKEVSEGKREKEEIRTDKTKNNLNEKISKIFITIGIPPHIKGYQYLREGIKMAVENPDIINNITKELYPKIGEKFETSASKVERAIRHAIEVGWNRGRIESLNAILGIKAYFDNDRPTNSEFIALIADKLLLEIA